MKGDFALGKGAEPRAHELCNRVVGRRRSEPPTPPVAPPPHAGTAARRSAAREPLPRPRCIDGGYLITSELYKLQPIRSLSMAISSIHTSKWSGTGLFWYIHQPTQTELKLGRL